MKLRAGGVIAALIILVLVAALISFSEKKLYGGSTFEQDGFGQILVPFSEAKKYDVILDVSPDATNYIAGAVNLNYMEFFDKNNHLKSDSLLSRVLGDAGISRSDSVLVYGKCQPCGGGPSAATYVYWVLKYLGQDKLGLLDGEIEDWIAAGLPAKAMSEIRPKTNYTPNPKAELMATYDFVNSSSSVQIVDARTPQDYDIGSIPGSVNIPYDAVLENGKLKNQTALNHLFVGLDKNRSVVVYTITGVKASMVCCALELAGYKACLYTWNDWIDHGGSEGIGGSRSPPGSQNVSK
jgi:thiosulfate/3-mercaptopyruvate sulfurtransferase